MPALKIAKIKSIIAKFKPSGFAIFEKKVHKSTFQVHLRCNFYTSIYPQKYLKVHLETLN